MPGVVLKTLTKRYGDLAAVEGLSLEVGPGELVSLLGPSGCGKTTTLRLVAGFLQPDSGARAFRSRVPFGVLFAVLFVITDGPRHVPL